MPVRQDLSSTYLAQHELERVFFCFIIIIIIVMIITTIVLVQV